jgi:hypothetical protein
MNDTTRKQIDSGAVFSGLVLIAVGVLFLLERLGLADFHYVIRHYWPLIIVIIGLSKVLRRQIWGGFWLIAIGAWLQISYLRLFGLSFSSSWPLLLIALGVGMIARTIFESARRQEPASPEEHREG